MSQSSVTTPADVRQLGNILSVWAHPDDETYSCGGLMAAAVQNGQQVTCVTATKGEAGIQDESRWPADELGAIRERELNAALHELGIENHHWLGYKDGCCSDVSFDDAVSQIRNLIDMYKPDTILTFGPDGMTGHPDHQTVSAWVHAAAQGRAITVYHAVEEEQTYEDYLKEADKKFNIYFNIGRPPLRRRQDCPIGFIAKDEILQKKLAALKAMPSQTEAILTNTPQPMLQRMLAEECFVMAGAR